MHLADDFSALAQEFLALNPCRIYRDAFDHDRHVYAFVVEHHPEIAVTPAFVKRLSWSVVMLTRRPGA
jgi:hypothetical protein